MTKPTIECAPNGPLIVKNLTSLNDAKGTAHENKPMVALCRCGESKNKPFCDGAHAKAGFSSDKQEGGKPDKRDTYAGEKITIHDNRAVCAHAGICTAQANAVWKQKSEPWIDANGDTVEKIIDVVNKCPSGALSYSIDGKEVRAEAGDCSVFIAPNGPYAVRGDVELKGVTIGEGALDSQIALCRCGDSKNKPFCDGSHWYKKFDEHAPDAKVYKRDS